MELKVKKTLDFFLHNEHHGIGKRGFSSYNSTELAGPHITHAKIRSLPGILFCSHNSVFPIGREISG